MKRYLFLLLSFLSIIASYSQDQLYRAYIGYFDRAQSFYSTCYAMTENDNTLKERLGDYQTVLDNVIAVKWENGTYSEEDCEEMADLKATRLYQYLNANTPDIVGGKYQIGSVKDLQWLARMVNGGSADIAAELTAPIDLEGVTWTPIGTVAAPFTGSFDGHLFPITNINNMLFGTITGAQITGVALESGEITTTNTADAPHTGSIVGHSTAASGSITNSYSKVAMNGSNGEDMGGIAGKYLGTMKNVAFLGSFAGSLSTWSMGGLAGSTNSTNTTFISDCMVYCDWGDGLDPGYGARGGLVGWCHTNTVNSSYVVVNSTDHTGFTKLLGDGTGSLAQSEFKSLDQFASGEVAYLMNADQDQPAWFQTLGKDAYPVLDNTHKVVYFADGVYYNEKDETVPEADLLDVVFHEDGTAEDVSPMHSTVELCGTTSSTYYNQTYQRYTARFENPWGKTCTGYYKVDFENNEAIRSALADGHTLEMLVMGDYEGTIEDVEAKPFSAMQGGGTGFLICKTNSEGRQNEFTFLPNVTTTGNSTWRWTNSGVVPQPKTYYHVVGVWNKEESKAYIYVNGELCNTIDASGDFRFANAGCNWFCIGGDADPNGGGQGWTGDVAIARAYDKALTPEEAVALWNKLSDETGIGVIAPYAFYIYRNDGIFNTFYCSEVDSIIYSCIDTDGEEQANPVTQEIWTSDSMYRIPLNVIDSISFVKLDPIAITGRNYNVNTTTATIECTYKNVPSGADCGYFLDEESLSTSGGISMNHSLGAVEGTQVIPLSGLKPGTTYYYTAAISYDGKEYMGEEKSFTTDFPDLSGVWTFKQTYLAANTIYADFYLESSDERSVTYKAKPGFFGIMEMSCTFYANHDIWIYCWGPYGNSASFVGKINDNFTSAKGDGYYYGTPSWAVSGWDVEEPWSFSR